MQQCLCLHLGTLLHILSRVLLRLPVWDQVCRSTPAPGLHTAQISVTAAAVLGVYGSTCCSLLQRASTTGYV